MLSSLRSEFRKIFSIRSTFVCILIAILYMGIYDFYVVGYRAAAKHRGDFFVNYHSVHYIFLEVVKSGGLYPPVLFGSIVAVLLMAHEYRYNTIMYTLTSSNSRSKTLLAKFTAVTGFSILFGLMISVIAPSFTYLGMHIANISTVGQVFYFKQFIFRVLFYTWAYSMIGLLLAIFFRNIVASILALFIIPVAIEPLVGLLLTTNQQQYMPFNALSSVLDNGTSVVVSGNVISASTSTLVVLTYLIVLWLIAWVSFIRRDAN